MPTRLQAAFYALFLGAFLSGFSLYGPWTNVHGRARFFFDLFINPAVGFFGNIGAAFFFATFGLLSAALALTGNLRTSD